MTSKNTTIDSYHTTEIDGSTTPTSKCVWNAFDRINRFQHKVTVNGNNEYLVGGRDEYQLYYPVESETECGIAGRLETRQKNYDDPKVLVFVEADHIREGKPRVIPVESLTVTFRTEFGALESNIDAIKTELTGENWVPTGRARTNYGDWNDAILSLYRFYKETYDDAPFELSHNFLKGATMHAIARYPSTASKLLSSVEMRLDRLDGEDVEKFSPFAVERVMLDFAADAELLSKPSSSTTEKQLAMQLEF